ncbi:hypothetical protein KBX06_27205 [Micromonospora sp. C31]|nr:hypothetical protein [Micromonospora sp. C31]
MFLSVMLGADLGVKQLGLGLAVAVFVDATIVRLILLPATMELVGRFNWWLPSWLDRALPRVRLDEPEPTTGPTLEWPAAAERQPAMMLNGRRRGHNPLTPTTPAGGKLRVARLV